MQQLKPLPNEAFDERINAIATGYEYSCAEFTDAEFDAFKRNLYNNWPISFPYPYTFDSHLFRLYFRKRTFWWNLPACLS
jgi:hypothetical protein